MSSSPTNPDVRILMETLRQADGGTVMCQLATPQGTLEGTITASFFEEFTGTRAPELTPQRRLRIVQDNVGYLEAQAARQLLISGPQSVVLR